MKKFGNITALMLGAVLLVSGCGGSQPAAELPPAAVSFVEEPAVSYLGPEGTYTEEAAQFFFGSKGSFVPEETVDNAIAAAAAGTADYAVIPQENTLGGAVINYVDSLLSHDDVYVVGEVTIPISQTLMGIPGTTLADIRTVCSHAQGIKQSEQWRSENIPDAVTEEKSSTAAAASYVAELGDKSVAAVAAPGAAALYGLEVLAENVQITDTNKTRFYVLSKERMTGGTNAVFVISCEAKKLDDAIVFMENCGVEPVSVHDRPEGSRLGMYNYIIEVESKNGITDDKIGRICSELQARFLGSFNAVSK